MKLDITGMALSVGGSIMQPYDYGEVPDRLIIRFDDLDTLAKLIIERCAKECDTEWDGDSDTYEYANSCNNCAEAIRELKVAYE